MSSTSPPGTEPGPTSSEPSGSGPDPTARARTRSAILVCAGLAVELTTLFWSHPLAFLAFALVGGTLILLGAANYAWFDIVSTSPTDSVAAPDGAASP